MGKNIVTPQVKIRRKKTHNKQKCACVGGVIPSAGTPQHAPVSSVSDLPAAPLGSCATLNEEFSFHFFLTFRFFICKVGIRMFPFRAAIKMKWEALLEHQPLLKTP